MSLYAWIWDKILPISKEEIELHNAEVAALREYERTLRAQAELDELQIKETRARIALIEEENQRQRDLLKPYNVVALVDFDLLTEIKNEPNILVTSTISCEETCPGGPRRINSNVVRKSTGELLSLKDTDKLGIDTFIQSRPAFKFYIQPWIDGKINTSDLNDATTIGDICCRRVQLGKF